MRELEERQGPPEGELTRLTAALFAQKNKSLNEGPFEEQCEMLKSQMIVYKEDFHKERIDMEILHEQNKKYKQKVEDSEEIIRQLTTQLDACTASEEFRLRRDGSAHLNERVALSTRQHLYPHHLQGCTLMGFVVQEL